MAIAFHFEKQERPANSSPASMEEKKKKCSRSRGIQKRLPRKTEGKNAKNLYG
jgi:hypothetical protein